MQGSKRPSIIPWRRAFAVGSILIFVGLCATPYVGWAHYPSLFDDDFTRVGRLRRSTPASSLLRPFNEHLAPLFEMVSWVAWWAVRQRVEGIATGFFVAAYLATMTTVVTLAAVVRLELRSTLAAMVAVSLFCLSKVSAETVLWYSASSFQWAAATSLAAWFAATKATRSASPRIHSGWLVAAAFSALASPLFSAIGALGGPLASLRLFMASEPKRTRLRLGRPWGVAALVPSLGTFAYAALVVAHQTHSAAVSASVRQHLDLPALLWATIRAPSSILIPEMVGLSSLTPWWSRLWAALATTILGVAVVAWGWRSQVHRGLIAVGGGWVVGGYLLAYSARAQPGNDWILEVGRYHLFPEIGVICWASAILGPWLHRLEARKPGTGLAGVVVIAAIGFASQSSAMSETARQSFRYPQQGRAIAAALRLEAICQAERIPLEQAIRIIDPIEPRWFPRALPFHPLLYLFGPGPPLEVRNDGEARSQVITQLSPDDREAIFGRLDTIRYSANNPSRKSEEAPLRLKATRQGVEARIGEGILYFNEFVVPERTEVVTISLAGMTTETKLEIWWSSGDGTWDSGRSVRSFVGPDGVNIPLANLPHWRTGFARRFRVIRRHGPLPTSDRLVVTCLTRPA